MFSQRTLIRISSPHGSSQRFLSLGDWTPSDRLRYQACTWYTHTFRKSTLTHKIKIDIFDAKREKQRLTVESDPQPSHQDASHEKPLHSRADIGDICR